MWLNLLPIIVLFVVFYFLLIRPQQKRQKKVREMQSSLAKGNTIVTIGGIHGTVHQIDENQIVIDTGFNGKLTFDRSAVREVKAGE